MIALAPQASTATSGAPETVSHTEAGADVVENMYDQLVILIAYKVGNLKNKWRAAALMLA